MDRRSWPWKKKSSESKTHDLPLESSTVISSRSHQYHDEQYQQATRSFLEKPVDDPAVALQHCQEKSRILSEKLSLALTEITSKDNLVKQHAKVAEEAVSGWEKAETEAANLKKQLDASTQKNVSLENRLAHLDGALKECMRELRSVREEHEQKLQETLVKKAKEWEKVRQEMEAKLAAANDRAIESEAQKHALNRSLQERAKAISELTEAKARAEVQANVTQVQREEVEKACAALKYEVQVLTKEVEIRNDEKDYNKKMADVVSKQQLENVKKIAKLEAECQRLRGLVRKKLPGPAAVAQMRLEVDGSINSRSKSMGARVPSPVAAADSGEEAWQADNKENDALSGRLLAMEEETKMLKEALTKKNQELQSARLMCAKTASKLSLVEEQLERSQGPAEAGGTKAKANSNGNTSADSWASALVAQLEQFKKGKDGSLHSEKLFESSNFDLMDDFTEMERLATTSFESTTDCSGNVDESDGDAEFNNCIVLQDDNAKLKAEKGSMEQELSSANERIERLKAQLSESEQLVSTLRVQLASMEESKQLAENQLAAMANVKDELESKVRASCAEMGHLQEKILALENELQEQRQRHEQVMSSVQSHVSQGGASENSDPGRLQEREIAAAAEKLADCQRTIMALGKQLHSLSVPTGSSSKGSLDFSETSMSPADASHHQRRPEESFALKPEAIHSESDDEELQWKVQRSASDMSRLRSVARENIRRQEIYWSSALSPEAAASSLDSSNSSTTTTNGEKQQSQRKLSQDGDFFACSPASAYSKNSGFSRFFHRRASLH
ncbi:filament-like plant protein 4 [Selaginella moellendorffii]|nr:filament-like plant protein 4 [Selaginella moellendorffii]|eukprot:XP_002989895.2 filament-like plant protein 4 [Selaginella moellendorffii]